MMVFEMVTVEISRTMVALILNIVGTIVFGGIAVLFISDSFVWVVEKEGKHLSVDFDWFSLLGILILIIIVLGWLTFFGVLGFTVVP